MQPKARKLLEDVRDAASFILAKTAGLNEQAYAQDRLLRQGIERNFEIIAASNLIPSRIDAARQRS